MAEPTTNSEVEEAVLNLTPRKTKPTVAGVRAAMNEPLPSTERTDRVAQEREAAQAAQMTRPEKRAAQKAERQEDREARKFQRQNRFVEREVKATPAELAKKYGPFSPEFRAAVAGAALPQTEEEEVDVVDPVEEVPTEEVPEVPEVPRVSGPGFPEQTVTPAPEEPALDAEVAEAVGVEEAVEEAEEAEVVDTPETEDALEAAGVDETDSEQEVAEKTGKVTSDESPVETEARRGMFGPVERLTMPQLRQQARQERRALRGKMGDITGENAEDMLMAARAAGGTKAEIRDRRQQKRGIRQAMRGKNSAVPKRLDDNFFKRMRDAAAAKATEEDEDEKSLGEETAETLKSIGDTVGGTDRKPKPPKSNLTDTQVEGMAGVDVDETLALEQLESLPDAVIEGDEADLDKEA